jgi:hypothetical protein
MARCGTLAFNTLNQKKELSIEFNFFDWSVKFKEQKQSLNIKKKF